MSELKPCPFCGNEPVVEGNLVACNNLNCPTQDNYWTGPMIFTCDQWNTRPIEDALQAENEWLKEELQQEKTRSQLNLEAEERRMLNITYYCAEIDRLNARIAELEKDNDEFRQLIHDWIIILTPDDGYVPDSECNDVATPIDVALRKRIAELEKSNKNLIELGDYFASEIVRLNARIAELEAAQRWIPVSERLPDGGHREFYEVACIYQDFGELALFSKGRWVIYEGENVYDVTKQVKFWRKRQYLPDEVIAILSKGKMKPEVQDV